MIRAVRERYVELMRQCAGMSRAMNDLLADYSEDQLGADGG